MPSPPPFSSDLFSFDAIQIGPSNKLAPARFPAVSKSARPVIGVGVEHLGTRRFKSKGRRRLMRSAGAVAPAGHARSIVASTALLSLPQRRLGSVALWRF